jgi:hypothetical protein
LRLTPGQVRASSASATLTIPPGDHQVRFELEHGETPLPPAFEVALRPVGGAVVWSERVAVDPGTSQPGVLVVVVPSSRLAADDYIMTIAAVSGGRAGAPSPAYTFSILRP